MESTNKVYSVSDDEFIQICENSTSVKQINDKLGYTGMGTYTYQLIRKRISELKRPDLEEKFSQNRRGNYRGKIDSLSKDELKKMVENSQTLSECLDKIGVERTAPKNSFHWRAFNALKETLDKYNIDYSHLSQIAGIKNWDDNNKADITKYFTKNNYHGTGPLKRIIIREKLIPYICSNCGLTDEWNGKKLNLQLHHKDGDRTNNELTNLTFLCPNCHSQTENYCGKNTERVRALSKTF